MPDSPAFLELERLVRHLGEDLASYRRRAIAAEARLRDVERESAERDGGPRPSRAATAAKARERAQTSLGLDEGADGDAFDQGPDDAVPGDGDAAGGGASGAADEGDGVARLAALEAENAMLRHRLEVATARTRAMLERVRFLRQQRQEVGR